MRKSALIIGASGLVGGECLANILADTSFYRVVALTRSALSVQHPKLTNKVVDFTKPETYADSCAVDVVFSAIGTTIAKARSKGAFYATDYTLPFAIASMAKQNGATTHVLVSSIGADAQSPVFYTKVKGELENAITNLGFETNIILRPSILIGHRKEERPMEKLGQLVATKLDFLFLGPIAKYKAVKAKTVANAMVVAVKTYSGKHLVMENPEIIKFER